MLDVGRRERRFEEVGRRRQRNAPLRLQREDDLVVLEVGRFQPRLDAVREAHDRQPDFVDGLRRDDGGGLRFVLDQLARSSRVVPRRHVGRLDGRQGLLDLVFSRRRRLLRRRRQHDSRAVCEQRPAHRGGLLGGDARKELLLQPVLVRRCRAPARSRGTGPDIPARTIRSRSCRARRRRARTARPCASSRDPARWRRSRTRGRAWPRAPPPRGHSRILPSCVLADSDSASTSLLSPSSPTPAPRNFASGRRPISSNRAFSICSKSCCTRSCR